MSRILCGRLLADDLSGAAEAAGILHRHGRMAAVVIDGPIPPGVTAVEDLDVRNAGPAAAERIARAFSRGPRPDYIKIDSQLRGPVHELISAAVEASAVVLAPALPAMGRTVRDGVPLIGGVALASASGSAWRTEAGSAPSALVDLVPAGIDACRANLDEVRSGAFRDRLRRTTGERIVHIPDAVDTSDLDAIALAAAGAAEPITAIGSGGLLDSLVTTIEPDPPTPDVRLERADRVLLILGSLEPAVSRQRAALRGSVHTVIAAPHEDSSALSARITAALQTDARIVVVASAPTSGPHDVRVAQRIGAAVAGAVRCRPAVPLGLIGGETARQTLDSLGERSFQVAGEVHLGAVLGVASSGRVVVTRPGSFGDDESLNRIITTLLGDVPRGDHQEEGPL